MLTLTEFSMFLTGIIWGMLIIKPIWDIAVKIYKNAKENQNGNSR